jgi:Tol biopolymer transport system component
MKTSLIITLCLILISPLMTLTKTTAQDNVEKKPLELPECDIFLFDLVDTPDEMKISNGRNVTKRKGYDNQPWFTPDSQSFLFSANYDPHRTDIYEYFVESGETKQVTDSPTQEYSPQVSTDNKTISFVTDASNGWPSWSANWYSFTNR